jgi:VWFA-related protein
MRMPSTTSSRTVTWAVAAIALIGTPLLDALQQDRPSFRSSARIVELSAVVTDGDRNPVTGLTANDFQVFDDGKPQRVELFWIEGSPAPPRTTTPPPEPAREFSNRLPDTGGVTIILYDQFNTPFSVRTRARDHTARFLEQIRPDDRIGLYVLDSFGVLRVVHDFTSDATSLVRAVSSLRGTTPTPLVAAEDAAHLAALQAELADLLADDRKQPSGALAMRQHFVSMQGEVTIDALESIGRYLSGVQNRKNLIWVSAGFPLAAFDYRGRSKTKEINRATRALNDANVALYTVDARGLIPTFSGVPGQQTITTLSMVAGNQDIMQSLAEDTGGRAFVNTNDIHGAVRSAADDARMTYVLGYYPTNDEWDGRFHRIAVKMSRPGLEVRHRKGYFAVATEQQAKLQRSAALKAAVASPINASGLGMTLRIDPMPGRAAEYRLTVRVEPGAITLEQRGDEWHGAVDVIVAQLRADGAGTPSLDHRADIRVPGKRLEQFLRDGVSIDHIVTLTPDTERLRVVVRDIRTGTLGAIGVSKEQLQSLAR